MTLNNVLMELPQDDGRRLAVFTAAPGSPDAAALKLLTRLATGDAARVSTEAPYV